MPLTSPVNGANAIVLTGLLITTIFVNQLRRSRARHRSRQELLQVLKSIDSVALEEELSRRSVGSHFVNTVVRPRHEARAGALDAELQRLGIAAPDDEIVPGPPRKAYDTFARPREGEPCDAEYIARRAPLLAQQIFFLQRHELTRRNTLLRNVDDVEQGRANARKPRHNVTVVLDNLRSAENVGSIFRTADATRALKVITCGITATPPQRKLEKTSLGAHASVPCEHYESTLQAVHALRGAGIRVVALETVDGAIPMHTAPQLGDEEAGVALVLGNEVSGVDAAVLAVCDAVLVVPVFGVKNSLNVACCAAIALYEVLRRWGKYPSADAAPFEDAAELISPARTYN
jgi:tRNA G18 (ribose-2'-O)-methylase SpoU